ncbi:MAG: M48 family metallopeptidase [Desulfocurvibacter africanus]
MNIYLIIILAAILAAFALENLSRLLNARNLSPELPSEFQGVYDPDEYRRSQHYTRANQKLSALSDWLETPLLIAAIVLGWFNVLDQWLLSLGLPEIATGLLFMGVLALVSGILSLPFQVYNTFVIEERFGFNRTTPALFVKDRLKGLALSMLIGAPLLAALLWFFQTLGDWAWLAAWGLTTAVSLVLAAIGPTLILPLFNKFTPLEPGPLRERIEDFAHRQGFDLTGIFVMDGSRRSSKSNAFFTGLGKRKRIALFDTLLSRHDNDEILAVLAHEIGHSRLGHIKRMLAASVLKTGLLFGLMQVFIASPGLFAAFGMERMSVHAGLVFFLILYTPVSLVLSVLSGLLSRRHERQADAFAATTTGKPEAMARALKKLSVDNLSNLTPHPLNVFLHYSHPPVLERVRNLKSLRADSGRTSG